MQAFPALTKKRSFTLGFFPHLREVLGSRLYCYQNRFHYPFLQYNSQVCIAFALHRGLVVIPKTVNPARITENLKSTELKLDAEDMRRLRGLDRNYRWISGTIMMKEGGSVDDFWDVKEDEKFVVQPPGA